MIWAISFRDPGCGVRSISDCERIGRDRQFCWKPLPFATWRSLFASRTSRIFNCGERARPFVVWQGWLIAAGGKRTDSRPFVIGLLTLAVGGLGTPSLLQKFSPGLPVLHALCSSPFIRSNGGGPWFWSIAWQEQRPRRPVIDARLAVVGVRLSIDHSGFCVGADSAGARRSVIRPWEVMPHHSGGRQLSCRC